MARRIWFPVVIIGALVLSACNVIAGSDLALRQHDGVVVTGATVADLLGVDPDDIVGFRYNEDLGDWEQIPIQADERHMEDLKTLRNGSGSIGVDVLAYSDAAHNAGADPDTSFDNDDEVAFLAADTGGAAPGATAYPSGVVPGSGVEVSVDDPLTGQFRGGSGFVYLFERSGSLDPAAGGDYVAYTFAPDDPQGHSEDSDIVTERYATHFSARWTRDELRIPAPHGSGVDILDRHRNLFGPGVCSRSEDTFSAGGGGFATNIDGPVRAIRSYLGANSGTYTQREHLFYPAYEQVDTHLRVHQIPGIMDFYDLSPAAVGMTYASSNEPNGVTVDGVPDTVAAGTLAWETVTGSQGTLITTHELVSSVNPTMTSYYQDDTTPPFTQCTGDAFEYGAGGSWITSSIPNTDPSGTFGPHETFMARRHNVYFPGDTLAVNLSLTIESLQNPLTASASSF